MSNSGTGIEVIKFSQYFKQSTTCEETKMLKKWHNIALTLSLAQLKKLRNQRKTGGFIFTIPTILAVLGAVGSLAGGW